MKSTLTRALCGGAISLMMMAPAMVSAQESTNQVAVMTDWSVFADGNPKECWGVSSPKETVNTKDGKAVSVRRGDILLFVTFRTGGGNTGEVSFIGGYPFAGGSTVNVSIDGNSYELMTEKETAWTKNAEEDAAILAALKRGTTAVVTARSGKGTQTKDTFSLRGFTAAMEDAAKRCK